MFTTSVLLPIRQTNRFPFIDNVAIFVANLIPRGAEEGNLIWRCIINTWDALFGMLYW